jgi:hypothetical protein
VSDVIVAGSLKLYTKNGLIVAVCMECMRSLQFVPVLSYPSPHPNLQALQRLCIEDAAMHLLQLTHST